MESLIDARDLELIEVPIHAGEGGCSARKVNWQMELPILRGGGGRAGACNVTRREVRRAHAGRTDRRGGSDWHGDRKKAKEGRGRECVSSLEALT